MQVTGFPSGWPLSAAQAVQAASRDADTPNLLVDGQNSPPAAGSAASSAAGVHKATPLPFASMMDALLNAQSQTSPLILGADGKPDLRLSLIAGQSTQSGLAGAPGALGGVQIISSSDDGAADAFSLAGRSSDDVAQALIQQAGSSDGLSLADVLKTMDIDADTDAGRDVAKGVGSAWDLLTHGQSGPLSAADLAAAIQGYRTAKGEEVPAGGAAWRG